MIFGTKKYKVAFFTLGCKLNFAETSTIARDFQNHNYDRVSFNEKADIYVVNSCSVTETANKKSRQAIKKANKLNPKATIVVVGCYAQLKPEEIADLAGVNIVLCEQEKFNVLQYIDVLEKRDSPIIKICSINEVDKFVPSYSGGDRTRSFLKVQDGCDYNCTYCTIPLARGKSRNPSIESLVEQANQIVESGMKEIILTGVNIGDFGKSTGKNFLELIKALDTVEGIKRIRISSIEPNLLSDDIIRWTKNSKKIMPHFHIPLQSGSNRILALMKRRYKREILTNRIDTIHEIFPDACIGIDVIVGFPSETEFDFMDTYNFLNSLDISYLHVFSYSERENTPAIKLTGKVSHKDITKRSKKLHELSDQKKKSFTQKHLNSKRSVLFESYNNNGFMYGFTDNYIKVQTKYNSELVNSVCIVKLKELQDNLNVSIY